MGFFSVYQVMGRERKNIRTPYEQRNGSYKSVRMFFSLYNLINRKKYKLIPYNKDGYL